MTKVNCAIKSSLTAFLITGLTATTTLAQETSWKQNYMACSGNSPFINTIISQNTEKARPLLKIAGMQAWQITDDQGAPTIALTTEEGLTIVGKIIGPQGEDISQALLATVPNGELAANMPASSLIPYQKEKTIGHNKISDVTPLSQVNTVLGSVAEVQVNSQPVKPIVAATIDAPSVVPAPPASAFTANKQTTNDLLNQLGATAPKDTQTVTAATQQPIQTVQPNALSNTQLPNPPSTDAQLATQVPAPSAIGQSIAPTNEQQAQIDTLYNQAESERMWFSAGIPKEGAPIIYMMADPECPHCQWNIDELNAKILGGEIDLRIIATPITGKQGFESTLSIIHSQNVGQTFMNHMTAKTRGTPSVTQMDVTNAEKSVIQGIVDNINWMRTNKIPGVPFYFYKEKNVAKFAFAKLPDEALTYANAGQ